MIDELWTHLEAMEDERRFDGKSYPKGRCAWPGASTFGTFCHEFLICQIEILRPRLLVILGTVAQSSVEAMGVIVKGEGRLSLKATIGSHTTAVHYSSHPYGDFNFTDQRRSIEALALRNAWEEALI